mmetsp:Transcript_1109/g.2782  ORF Transcript_1109/g.2782 Transcript_1109/m.2782 type:complete len:172 (-) Transcript_1109:295-810(-)
MLGLGSVEKFLRVESHLNGLYATCSDLVLPDRNTINVTCPPYCSSPSLLFCPMMVGIHQPGLHEIIADVISQLTVEGPGNAQISTCTSVLLHGGLANCTEIQRRLHHYLQTLLPHHHKVCVKTLREPELAAFRGAAMVADHPAFTSMCVSRREWHEYGVRICTERGPFMWK